MNSHIPTESLILEAYQNREHLKESKYRDAVVSTIKMLDRGEVRVAEKQSETWVVHPWIMEAILLYFSLAPMNSLESGPFEYIDKIPLKTKLREAGVRVVPGAIARFGAYLGRGVILMPSFVNIGAHVGEGTMIDTWATVGSCAQIGRGVHISGGVGIGGVLEPPGARPVIIEDGAFIGSRCILVEGVTVEEEAVLGSNVTITASTQIVDVTSSSPRVLRGLVPRRSVVIPGTVPKSYPAGEFGVPCALIIGTRRESTDKKTTLNEVLREFALSV